MLCKFPRFLEKVGGIVPCGRCSHCRKNARRKKTTRMLFESKHHEHILFVTLTYSDKYLPKVIYDLETGEITHEHDKGCLDKRATQLFLKRLRKRLPPRSLRYFCAGEYGDKRGRPHYHFVLWGLPFNKKSLIYESWTDPVTGELMCDPNFIDVQIPRSDWDVSQYCCSYMMKGLTNSSDYRQEGYSGLTNAERLDGRPPEFNTSSKGIGLRSVEDFARVLQKLSGQVYIEMHNDIPRVVSVEGKKLPLDRYMRERILDALQIAEVAKEVGFTRYQEEMSLLQTRASQNPEIPKSWLLDSKRLGWALEKQFVSERSSEMAARERKDELHNAKRGDF